MSTQANAKNILKLAQAGLEEDTCTICYELSFFLTNLVNPFILAELGVESSSLQ